MPPKRAHGSTVFEELGSAFLKLLDTRLADLRVVEVKPAEPRQSLEAVQPGVRDVGAPQTQGFELEHSFQVLQPGVAAPWCPRGLAIGAGSIPPAVPARRRSSWSHRETALRAGGIP